MENAAGFFRLLGALLYVFWQLLKGICWLFYYAWVLISGAVAKSSADRALQESNTLDQRIDAERKRNNTLYGPQQSDG